LCGNEWKGLGGFSLFVFCVRECAGERAETLPARQIGTLETVEKKCSSLKKSALLFTRLLSIDTFAIGAEAPTVAAGESALAKSVRLMGNELSCSICLSLFDVPVMVVGCNHYFCEVCMENWLKEKASCPLCKAPLTRRGVARDERMASLVRNYRRIVASSSRRPIHRLMSNDEEIDEATAEENRQIFAGAAVTGGRRALGGGGGDRGGGGGGWGRGGGGGAAGKGMMDVAAVAAVEGVERGVERGRGGGGGAPSDASQHQQPETEAGLQALMPPPAATRVGEWTCDACTLINAARAAKCAVCGGVKPSRL
jgi:uncharacterized membrane protein YgcG